MERRRRAGSNFSSRSAFLSSADLGLQRMPRLIEYGGALVPPPDCTPADSGHFRSVACTTGPPPLRLRRPSSASLLLCFSLSLALSLSLSLSLSIYLALALALPLPLPLPLPLSLSLFLSLFLSLSLSLLPLPLPLPLSLSLSLSFYPVYLQLRSRNLCSSVQ